MGNIEDITPAMLSILRYSLGLDDAWHGREYRNYYAVNPDCKADKTCQALCSKGLMRDVGCGMPMRGGTHCYALTAEGVDFVHNNKSVRIPVRNNP